jgi:integrase
MNSNSNAVAAIQQQPTRHLSVVPTPPKKAANPSVAPGIIFSKTSTGEKRYLAQVRVKGHKPMTKSFDSLTAAKDWKKEQEVALKNAKPNAVQVPEKMTMPELFATYVERSEALGNPLPSLQVMLFKRMAAHPVMQGVLVSQMNEAKVRDYCKARKVADDICPSTIMSEFVRIDCAITRVAEWLGWGKFDPLDGVGKALRRDKLISESIKRHRRPSAQEMDTLLAFLDKTDAEDLAGVIRTNQMKPRPYIAMADIVRFAALNAFRRGELVELRWSALRGNAIMVGRKDMTGEDGKRECLVPLLPAAMEILKRLPRTAGEDRIIPVSGDTLGQRFTDACRAVKIEDLRFHDLRHEAISTISQHVGMSEAMMISGHKTAKHFMRYVNYGEEDAAKISAKLAGVTLKTAA